MIEVRKVLRKYNAERTLSFRLRRLRKPFDKLSVNNVDVIWRSVKTLIYRERSMVCRVHVFVYFPEVVSDKSESQRVEFCVHWVLKVEPCGSTQIGTETRTAALVFLFLRSGTGTGTVKWNRMEPCWEPVEPKICMVITRVIYHLYWQPMFLREVFRGSTG